MKTLTILVVVLLALGASAVHAEFLEIEASQIATIEPADKSAGPRILVQWNLPKDLDKKIVDGAVVTMTVAYTGDSPVQADVHPVTKSWDAETVTWSGTWSQAGGDFNADVPSPAVISQRNGGKISADVYHVTLDQIAGKVSNFGFILVPEATSEAQISTITANATAKLADAKLIIAYRNRR